MRDGMFVRALAAHEAGDASGAMGAYRAAIKTEPTHAAAAYSNLGMLLCAEARLAECIGASAAAAALTPRNAGVLYNLANAQSQSSREAEAEATYRRVIDVDPAHAPA